MEGQIRLGTCGDDSCNPPVKTTERYFAKVRGKTSAEQEVQRCNKNAAHRAEDGGGEAELEEVLDHRPCLESPGSRQANRLVASQTEDGPCLRRKSRFVEGALVEPCGEGEAEPVLMSARMLASVVPGAVPLGELTLQMGESQVPELWLAAARREAPRGALELRTLPAASTGAAVAWEEGVVVRDWGPLC